MDVTGALKGLVVVLWVGVVALIVLAVMRAYRGRSINATRTTIAVLAAAAVVLTSISAGLVFIEPHERGVVISAVAPKGYREEPLEPGLRWIIPYMERVQTYVISQQTYTMSSVALEESVQGDDAISARTSDGQEVFVDASVIYSVNPEDVVQVHIDWQDRYPSALVRPLVRGVIRDAISQYGVEEVYSSQRQALISEIETQLSEKMSEHGLKLSEFLLRNITFSPEYAASVEQKQIAEQRAEQARFTVEQRKQEAEQARQVAQGEADAAVINAQGRAQARLIEAEAEAKAMEMIAAVLEDNPDLLTYNYIDKIAPGVRVMLLPSDSPFILQLPEYGPETLADGVTQATPPPSTPETSGGPAGESEEESTTP